jgi:O-acetylserine/cysteine efflux transporter
MKPIDILSGVLVAVLWGLGITLAKAGMDQFPPILLTALRYAVTALALVWFVEIPRGLLRRIFLISIVAATIQYSLTFTGIYGIDASTASIVIQLEVPFATLLAAIFLTDRIGWRRIAGMVLAFAGVVLIAYQPDMRGELFSVFLVAAGAFTWAVGQVMIKTLGGAVGGFQLIAWVAVFAAPQLFAVSFALEDGHMAAIAAADWRGWAIILYLGLAMTALGYGMWFRLIGLYPVSHVMPFLLLLPVVTMTGGVLMLDETLTVWTLAGAALVLTGVGVILRRQAVRRPETQPVTAPAAVPPGD